MKTKPIKINELFFDCRMAGDEKNELIIFLHGFPETSYMWSQLMKDISLMGYYCVAFDQRGYSENACPKGAKNYKVDYLVEDVLGMAEAVGHQKFHLVGHDWGAVIGWHLVHDFPNKIISWTAMSVPHLSAFSKAFKTDKIQRKKSGYIKWFLPPFLPEIWLRRKDFSLLKRLWKLCGEEELAYNLSVFRRKKTLTGALNYYRANLGPGKGKKIGKISSPTLFLYGRKDLAIGNTAAEFNHFYMIGDYAYEFLDGGHWLIQSNYEDISKAVVNHVEKFRLRK